MLIKLTGIPHPALNSGKAQPVYIDASRILLISQGYVAHPKLGSMERNRERLDTLHEGVDKLTDMVNAYVPRMSDPVAVEWMQTARSTANEVNNAYHHWSRAWNAQDYHDRVECTEVQLACGTALEHGVMLTRVWVAESVEEVALAVARAPDRG